MRRRIILLATVGLVYASQSVFNVHDDLLAFPQYEVVFSDALISDTDAESRLAYAASSSFARAESTSETPIPDQETAGELAHRDGSSSPHSDSQDPNSADATDTYESMILNDKRYLCTIPRVQPPQNETFQPPTKADDEKELARASDRGWELLKDMEGHCMYFISGWWSYSFCYNTQIKQFHQLPPPKGTPPYPPLEDPTTPSYILGQFSNSQPDNLRTPNPTSSPTALASSSSSSSSLRPSGSTSLQTQGSRRYLVQKLSGGTTCDLTGLSRRVEIQFHCHPQSADRIGWIKEVATCAYIVVIYTPRLCHDVAFLPPRESAAQAIDCRPVVPDADVADFAARLAADDDDADANRGGSRGDDDGAAATEENPRPTIGGTVVGGMRLVGGEGRRLDPPSSPPASEPGKTALVAKMRPGEEGGKVQRVGDEEIRRLGFEPADVEELVREIEELAGGNGWRVEVVEVAAREGGGGREMRGVVEVVGEEEGEDERGEGEGEGEERREGSEEVYKDEL